MIVLSSQRWRNNGHLIAAVAHMHILPRFPEPRVMDVTYGRGIWWKVWRPDGLITHDLRQDGVDFRHLPEPDRSLDVVAYDPPYVSAGGRQTTTIGDMHDRFGLTDAPRTPAEMQVLINEGLDEVHRVLRPGGLALVKCCNYVSSGQLWIGTHYTLEHALQDVLVETGPGQSELKPLWKVLDIFNMVGSARAQPRDRKCRRCIDGTVTHWVPILDGEQGYYRDAPCERCGGTGRIVPRQQHARQNASTLYVLVAR